MGAIEGLAFGFSVLWTSTNLLAVFAGAVIGTLIGVLPGIGPAATMALLLPITMSLKMGPTATLIMFAGIYYGAMYGGTITSVLVKVPGEAASIVTCIDGYEMAKKGRAGAALTVAAVGSFVAGTIGVIGLMLFAPPLAQFALSFGPPEYFALALFALVTLSQIFGGGRWQGLLVLAAGLALATIGTDPITGIPRYTFGSLPLRAGISMIPAVMGLFGISEMLSVAEKAGGPPPRAMAVSFRELFPTRSEWRRSWPAALRGSVFGFFFGLLPGPAPILSTFATYRLEQRLSKHRDEFGHGAIEGVAGPESANNAAAVGAMIPLLSLGLPFAAAPAMLLAGLMVQGVQPGPMLITEHPEVFWGVVASMYIGNLALLALNLPLVGVWVSVLRIPRSVLVALIVLICLVGAYSMDNSLFNLIVLVTMGLFGYVLRKLGLDASPIILSLILGPMLEDSLHQSLRMSQGSPFIFFERPISLLFMIALLLVLMYPLIRRFPIKHLRMTR